MEERGWGKPLGLGEGTEPVDACPGFSLKARQMGAVMEDFRTPQTATLQGPWIMEDPQSRTTVAKHQPSNLRGWASMGGSRLSQRDKLRVQKR
jgi:hypothetical protein